MLAPTALAVSLGSFTVVSRSDSFITDVLTQIACYEDICVMERILSFQRSSLILTTSILPSTRVVWYDDLNFYLNLFWLIS
nr:MAG TPA: hypothetical protein [Caudoviricetes sp.]